jgi:hypothetical protein
MQPSFAFSEKRYLQKVKQVDRLLELLGDGQWLKAGQIAKVTGWNDRKVRELADFSGGRVISGDQGYKMTRFASVEEIDHAEARLLSQARKMTERATEIRRARNAGGQVAA